MAIKYRIEIENYDPAWLESFVTGLPHFDKSDSTPKTFLFRKDIEKRDVDVAIEAAANGMILTVYDFGFGRSLMGLLIELITAEKGKVSIDEV